MSPKPQPTQASLPTELHSRRQKFEQKPDTGALFKNAEKSADTDADYKGALNVEGREFWLNGWINTSQKTGQKYMKLSLKLKAAAAAAGAEKPPFDDDLNF